MKCLTIAGVGAVCGLYSMIILEIASGGATSISDDGITKCGPMRAEMWSVHLWQECWDKAKAVLGFLSFFILHTHRSSAGRKSKELVPIFDCLFKINSFRQYIIFHAHI